MSAALVLIAVLFVLCLAVSFLMSGMESGVFALNRLRIRHQVRAGNRRAALLHRYLENPEDFLWTILVGNTIANFCIVTIGVMGWHYLVGRSSWLFGLVLVVSGAIFYALFELLPKMLFRLYPNRLCLVLARPFRIVHVLLAPLVSLTALIGESLIRWTGGRRFTGRVFGGREELRMLMTESAPSLTGEERQMINRVLDLQKFTLREITIPMSKVLALPAHTPVSEVLAAARERGLSRIPVWRLDQARQHVVGVLSLDSLIYAQPPLPGNTAADFVKPALYLDVQTRLELALRQMQQTGQRLAIVLGRDRQEIGIVSLQDILQVIFGEVSL